MAGNERPTRTTSRANLPSRDGKARAGSGGGNRASYRSNRGGAGGRKWHSDWRVKLLLGIAACILLVCAVGGIVFAYYYHAYEHVVEERLRQPLFANTAKIYAAPAEVRPDQKYSVQEIAQELMRAFDEFCAKATV